LQLHLRIVLLLLLRLLLLLLLLKNQWRLIHDSLNHHLLQLESANLL
jgi:hypothetical protein